MQIGELKHHLSEGSGQNNMRLQLQITTHYFQKYNVILFLIV